MPSVASMIAKTDLDPDMDFSHIDFITYGPGCVNHDRKVIEALYAKFGGNIHISECEYSDY